MDLLIGLVIAYFGGLGVLTLIIWQFNPIMGVKLFKKGTGIFIRIAQKTLKLCFKVGVRIARTLWKQTNKFVIPWVNKQMPKAKEIMVSVITKIKNIQKGAI